MQKYVLFQPWFHVPQFVFLFFSTKATRNTHAHNNDMIVHCIGLTQSLTLHCHKQQDNEDMINKTSETSE